MRKIEIKCQYNDEYGRTHYYKEDAIEVGIGSSSKGFKKSKLPYVEGVNNGIASAEYMFVNGAWSKKNLVFTLTLGVDDENHGTVSAEVKSLEGLYDSTTGKIIKTNANSKVIMTLTATPAEGYTVSVWHKGTTPITGSEGELSIDTDNLTGDTTYTVEFTTVSEQEEETT